MQDAGCNKGRKFIQAKIRAIGIYTRLVCGWGENYTSQYKYEACIKRKNDMEGLYKKLMIIVIGLFFLLYFCQSIPLCFYADRRLFDYLPMTIFVCSDTADKIFLTQRSKQPLGLSCSNT